MNDKIIFNRETADVVKTLHVLMDLIEKILDRLDKLENASRSSKEAH